ncbi:Imm44 family immunity protein [Burkholderia reimsis]|nr:Imm44 family immunity protein [Burkholderia reimsis]
MKLWMSGENEADIGDDARVARNAIEPVVNQFLEGLVFTEKFEQWAFLSIILTDKFLSGFPEVVKISSKGKVLEFRLHIPHEEFKKASAERRMEMFFDALSRSIELMPKLKVSQESQEKFRAALAQARKSLLSA